MFTSPEKVRQTFNNGVGLVKYLFEDTTSPQAGNGSTAPKDFIAKR